MRIAISIPTIIALLTATTAWAAVPPSDLQSAECYERGVEQATEQVDTSGQSTLGFVLGALTCFAAPVILANLQNEPNPGPEYLQDSDDPDCKIAHLLGYQNEGLSKKKSSLMKGAFWGAFISTTAAFIVISTSD